MGNCNRIVCLLLLLGLGVVPTASGASLFLSSWGISYGNWAPNGSAPENFYCVVEDWAGGNGGFLDPGHGGDLYDSTLTPSYRYGWFSGQYAIEA
jgi:hypothetical protein